MPPLCSKQSMEGKEKTPAEAGYFLLRPDRGVLREWAISFSASINT